MTIGDQIIDEIIKQKMLVVNHPDPAVPHVFVWSSTAAGQLHALVRDSAEVQVPLRAMDLFSEALSRLGAPDDGDPRELLEWAESTGRNLKTIALAESFFGDACTFLSDAGHKQVADKFRALYAEKISELGANNKVTDAPAEGRSV